MDLGLNAAYLGLILFAAKLGEELATRIGIPGLIGVILAGLLLGEAGLSIVPSKVLEETSIFYMIGLSFVLFLAGAEELSPHGILIPTLREILVAGVALIVPTMLIALISMEVFGLELSASIAYGIAISIASLGPAVKLTLHLERPPFQILRIALVLELLGILLFNSLVKGFSISVLAVTVMAALVVYLFGRRMLTRLLLLLERKAHSREAPFAVLVAIILGASFTAEVLGFNAAVTALMFGVFASDYLSKRPFFHERLQALTYGLLEPLFFAGIGLGAIKPAYTTLVYGISMALLALVVKMLVSYPLCKGVRMRALLLLSAKGGVDASLLYTGMSGGLFSQEVYTAGVTALLVSTLVSAVMLGPSIRGRYVRERWRSKVSDLPLGYSIVPYTAPAYLAAEVAASRGAVVVVDNERRPLGYISSEDLVHIDPALLDELKAADIMRVGVLAVHKESPISELAADLAAEPIVAVVDDEGKVVGTITSRQFLAWVIGGAGKRGSGSGRGQHSVDSA